MRRRRAVGGSFEGTLAGGVCVGGGLVAETSLQRVMGRLSRVRVASLGPELLEGVDRSRVQRAAPLAEQAAIDHLVRERVSERILVFGKETHLVEELGGQQMIDAPA